MASEATELRVRAENLHLLAGAYEMHAVHPANSPTALAAYETVLNALTDGYMALIAAADMLDDQLPLPLVRAVPVGFDRVWIP